jgi:hypothetical protein
VREKPTILFEGWRIFSCCGPVHVPPFVNFRQFEVDAGVVHTLIIDSDTRRVLAVYDGCPSRDTLNHCLNDLILPRLLASNGDLVLHGSLVSTAFGLVGFIGASGWGKSTLAASFAARDATLLTDDAFRMQVSGGEWRGERIFPSLRLFPDAIEQICPEIDETAPVADYTTKRRLQFLSEQESGLLRALFRLADDAEDVRVTRLAPAEACIALVSNAFALEANEPREAAKRFANAAEAAKRLPVFNLVYPRDFGRLGEVHTAVLGAVKQCQLKADSP